MDAIEINEEETSSDSSTETETEENNGESSDAGAGKTDATDWSKYPLDKHPRWAEREADWDKRFKQQQEEFDAKLEALHPKQSEEKIDQNASIPKWFGGDQEQWKDFVAFHNKGIEDAEKRAYDRLTSSQSAKEKAVSDANTWFEESVSGIEKEAGKTIDRNALLKTVIDNELIDAKGRWNYKAAWQILKGQSGGSGDSREDRKRLADDTNKDSSHADTSTKGVKSSEDFKKDRPW